MRELIDSCDFFCGGRSEPGREDAMEGRRTDDVLRPPCHLPRQRTGQRSVALRQRGGRCSATAKPCRGLCARSRPQVGSPTSSRASATQRKARVQDRLGVERPRRLHGPAGARGRALRKPSRRRGAAAAAVAPRGPRQGIWVAALTFKDLAPAGRRTRCRRKGPSSRSSVELWPTSASVGQQLAASVWMTCLHCRCHARLCPCLASPGPVIGHGCAADVHARDGRRVPLHRSRWRRPR